MKRNQLILVVVVVILVIIIIYSFQGQSPESYKKEILNKREEQENFMRNSDESPFITQKIKFAGLDYFEPDPKFKIKAQFEPIKDKKIVQLATSDNAEEEYLEYGYASFTLDNKPQSLLILENVSDNILFLPFGDATSTNETYGGGRYLDVKHSSGNSILLDFNLAYNPYCAYTEGYSCPLPPNQNLLVVAIKAGEKTYEH